MRDAQRSLDARMFGLPAHVRRIAYAGPATIAATTDDGKRWTIELATGAIAKRPRRRADGAAVRAEAMRDHTVLYGDDDRELRRLGVGGWEAAVAGAHVAIVGAAGVVVVDAVSGDERARHAVPARHVALSPDGARLLVAGRGPAWEGPIAGPLRALPEAGPLAHGGERFAIGDAIYSVGRDQPDLHAGGEQLTAIALSPEGTHVAIAAWATVRVVALAALAAAPPPIGPAAQIVAIASDPVRGRLAAIDRSGLVCVWRADATLEARWRVAPYEHPIAFARDGHLLIGTTCVEVWDVAAARRVAVCIVPALDRVSTIAVGERCTVVGDPWRLAILEPDLAVRRLLFTEREHPEQLAAVALSPSGHRLAVAYRELPTRLIDTATGDVVRELPPAAHVALGDELVVHAEWSHGTLEPIEGGASEEILPFERAVPLGDRFLLHKDARISVRGRHAVELDVEYPRSWGAVARGLAPDRFVTASEQWLAQRSLSDGVLRQLFAGGTCGKLVSLAFDPSGARLAVGEQQGRLHVWELGASPARLGFLDGTTLQPAGTVRAPGRVGEIAALAFTADELVACATEVLAWSVADLARIGTTEPRTRAVSASRISRDGQRTFEGGDWNPYVVRDAAGAQLSTGPGSDARDRFADLSDDGSRVLVGTAAERASELSVARADGTRLGTLRVEGTVQFAAFDAHGRVVGGVERGPWFRWDPSAGTVERWCAPPPIAREHLAIVARAPDRIALTSAAAIFVLSDAGALLATLAAPSQPVTTCTFSPDARLLAAADWHGRVHLYDLADGGRCITALGHTAEGGWWSIGSAGYTYVPGEPTRRDWEAT